MDLSELKQWCQEQEKELENVELKPETEEDAIMDELLKEVGSAIRWKKNVV